MLGKNERLTKARPGEMGCAGHTASEVLEQGLHRALSPLQFLHLGYGITCHALQDIFLCFMGSQSCATSENVLKGYF